MPRPPPTSIRRGSSACSSQNRAEPAHDAFEHAGIVDLRAEVHVQAAPVEPWILPRLDARPRGVGGREAELRAGCARSRSSRGPPATMPGVTRTATGWRRPWRSAAAATRAPSSSASSTTRPQPAAIAASMSASVLPLPCTTISAGSMPARSAAASSPALATSAPRPQSREQSQHADGAAGLAGERDVGVGMPGDAVDVGLRALAQRGGVVDVERRAEALRRAPRRPRRRSGGAPPSLSAVAGQGEPSGVTNAPRRASPRCAR